MRLCLTSITIFFIIAAKPGMSSIPSMEKTRMTKFEMQQVINSIHSYEEFETIKQNTQILEFMANEILQQNNLPEKPLTLFKEGTNIIFAYGKDKVIKIFPSIHTSHFENEKLVLMHLHNKLSVATPHVEFFGKLFNWPYLIMSRVEGTVLEELWEKIDPNNKIILIRELGFLIREVQALPTTGLEQIDCHWEEFIQRQIAKCEEQHRTMNLPEPLLQQIPKYLNASREFLPKLRSPVLLTGEYTPMNIMVTQKAGIWHITGLIDFGDSMLGMPEYDLLGPGAFLIQGNTVLLKEFLLAYGYAKKSLTPQLSHQLTVLMLLHRYSNLNAQIRIQDWKSKVNNLQDLESLVWGL